MAKTPQRLHHQLRRHFILQALGVALLLVAGTFIGSKAISEYLLRDRIRTEVTQLWALIERNPKAPLPKGLSYEAYFVPVGSQPDQVPAELRVMSSGFHRLNQESWLQADKVVYVGDRAPGKIFVVTTRSLLDRVVVGITVLSGLMSLIAVWAMIAFTNRRLRRLMLPLVEFSHAVDRWDPERGEVAQLKYTACGESKIREVERLRNAVVDMAGRMNTFVERERNFTRDASHELRTPLTVVRMAHDMLTLEPELSQRGTRALSRIDQVTREMEGLVESLLVLARHPNVEIEVDQFYALPVVEEAIARIRDHVDNPALEIHLDARANPMVEAPPRMLAVVLNELLENAVSFTERGNINVVLRDNSIDIIDTGIGMSADTLARVFDPFFREDISRQNAKGLGLNVVRRLVDRIGWTLSLRSRLSEGTIATLGFRQVPAKT
ncbi:HAMP domain-containing histidine kinase [Lysobacter sp. HDW10]|uniref:sensor histidine kinase n=1 Tax=Lysobacter sp. HDW10 TaxID=2714936 RepID=UPI0014090B3C|nr:HAMP domain-containing sensor histidine kinase [Lysobacter sp. HDW10]QIK81182.1 HAMP domain-containing histidine kinase [Lysobacter sp. HDW10]